MNYQVKSADTAKREIARLPGYLRQRARRLIANLANNPRPAGAKALRDLPEHYRLRLESWRIVYQIDNANQLVLILTVRRKIGPQTYDDL